MQVELDKKTKIKNVNIHEYNEKMQKKPTQNRQNDKNGNELHILMEKMQKKERQITI